MQAINIREGLYFLADKQSRTNLDLSHGNANQGARVQGYAPNVGSDIGNQMWLIKQEGLNDTYTIRNLQSGTYLDLKGGSRENGSLVVGWTRQLNSPSRSNQEWRIQQRGPRYYAIQCSRTEMYLEITGGNPKNATPVTCSQAADKADHQLWTLDLISRTAPEIRMIFESWKENIRPLLFGSDEDSVQYFGLPNQVRWSIWDGTELLRQPLRPQFFGDGNFVISMKDAVTVWVRDRFKTDIRGYSVLFGMIYGQTEQGPTAYNWYLSPDLCSLVLFDPQNGKEYGPAALDGFGFEPTFVLF